MEGNTSKLEKKLLKQKKRHRYWRRVVGVLASVVVFCTTYALILPAITMEKEVICGMEEHQHEESCYVERLICEESTDTGHEHTEDCYETVPVCGMEEHTHGADCYPDEESGESAGEVNEEAEESKEAVREASAEEPEEAGEAAGEGSEKAEESEEEPEESEEEPEEETEESEEEPEEETEEETEKSEEEPEEETEESEEEPKEETEESKEELEEETEEPGGETEESEEEPKEESEETEKETEEETPEEAGGVLEEFAAGAGEDSEDGPEEFLLEASGDTCHVRVVYGSDAGIPKGARLKVEELDAGSDAYQEELSAAAKALETKGEYIYKAAFFDISIMDGEKEIEPQSAVQVQIELTAEEHADAEDLVVTHENEVIPDVDTTEEDGGVTVLFETDSFSHYGTIYKGESVTIETGDTVELSGTESYTTNAWSVSQSDIVELEETDHTAVATGKSAGTVTVTHTYTKKQGNKAREQTEQFTVTVTASEDAVLTDETSEYTVTVRGNKKALADGATLHVEDYTDVESDYQDYYDALTEDLETETSADITEDSYDFLHMYHIYLTKDGVEGEYIPEENVNLQVTITYDRTPDNWGKAMWVGHYRKSNGSIRREDVSDGSASASGVKQIKVSGNSITFHIQSFSVFPVAALSEDSGGGSSVITPVEPGDNGTYGDSLTQTAGNSWQIVSGGYAGNDVADKTPADDGLVRVQKNVVPTDTENEFLIYLSVDKKVSWEEIIQASGLYLTTSGSYKANDIGTILTSKPNGNGGPIYPVSSESSTNQYTATVTLTRGGVTVDTVTQTYYGTTPNSSNATGFLMLTINGDTRYVCASVSVNLHQDGSGSGGALTYTVPLESLESSFDFADYTVGYDGVTDVMGDYISYVGVLGGDYDDVPSYDPDTAALSWVPVQKSGLLPVYTDGTKITGWYLNSAELVYRVTLDTAREGFQSCAEYLKSGGSDQPYNTNASASLSYHWSGESAGTRSTQFSSPQVRGLLYDVIFDKVDADDSSKGVDGAAFVLTDSSKATVGETVTTAGTTRYEIASGLPCGTYVLTETLPSGYSAVDKTSWTIVLCYTDSPDSLAQCGTHTQNLRNAESDAGVLTIENKKNEITIVLRKADMNDASLSGAEFRIYDEDRKELSKGLIPSGTDGVFSPSGFCLEPGTYYLEETAAPDGYLMPEGMFKLVVTSENISVCSYESAAEGNYRDSSAKNFAVQDNAAEVTIYNSAGAMLPATGGPGTFPYILSGLGLVLISCFMYGYRMRYRREGRGM